MNSEDRVITALRTLAEQDRELEAPAHIEMRLLQEFRKRRAQKRLWTLALAGLAAAAGLMIVFLVGSREQPKPVPARHPTQPSQFVAAEDSRPEIQVAPVRKTPKKLQPVAQPVKAQPREVVTDFFPLLDAPPPFERGELLRVVVPASTMRRVGLPVSPDRMGDRVYADVLVGQEGLARAIRFVSYEQ
jgi:hypothetical protein